MSSTVKKATASLKARLLRNRKLAVVVLTFTVSAAIIGAMASALDLYEQLFPPSDFHYAQKIRDEYFVLLATVHDREAAKSLHGQLLELSNLSARYDKDPSTPIIGSSSIMIGFEPDQIVYAPSDKQKGQWVVGLDLEAGQGSTKETEQLLVRIRNRFINIENEFRGPQPHVLPQAAEKLRPYFDKATVQFYSSVEFRNTYGTSLAKE